MEKKTAEQSFEEHFDKFRHGIFRSSLDHFLETGRLSGSLLLSVREYAAQFHKQETAEQDGFVRNCYIKPKRDNNRPLFDWNGMAHLDGYAIIPLSEYESMLRVIRFVSKVGVSPDSESAKIVDLAKQISTDTAAVQDTQEKPDISPE